MTSDGRDDAFPEELISAYLDGELAPAERAAVERRVGVSPSWAEILREVRETRAAVRGLPAPEPPAGFLERLLDVPAVGPVRAARGTRRPVLGPWRWAAGGAAAAAVAVAFVVPSPHRVTPSVPTQVESHATRASLTQDPIMQLAPVAQPVRFGR